MKPTSFLFGLFLFTLSLSPVFGGNWPAWRGPDGDGVTAETDLPLQWDRDRNIAWRAPLPEPGNSTPIVWEDRIFLTQAGDVFIYAADTEFDLLARNSLGERTNSSVVPSNGRLYLRTHEALWCVGPN